VQHPPLPAKERIVSRFDKAYRGRELEVRIRSAPAKSLLRTLNLGLSQSRGSPSETPPGSRRLAQIGLMSSPRTTTQQRASKANYESSQGDGQPDPFRPCGSSHSPAKRAVSTKFRQTHWCHQDCVKKLEHSAEVVPANALPRPTHSDVELYELLMQNKPLVHERLQPG